MLLIVFLQASVDYSTNAGVYILEISFVQFVFSARVNLGKEKNNNFAG